ncbi:DEAD box RNA helicase family protein [Actinidia rufa]|uniref:DEAD box RNA helicase family protein n=1 Tax=Actinidia rufa TaxID=165716 RepID=A0A7J0DHJ7_9ERIC|nr:DEAD box RNA helicase family protein [Actinidia rufa]
MASATVSSTAPCYAPKDPSLPKPWRGLVDGKTGYLYFWNLQTNATQYERSIAPLKLSAPLSSSFQVQQSSQGKHRDNGYNDDGDRYSRGSNGGSKVTSGTKDYQGDNVYPPFASFETTGFPLEILRENSCSLFSLSLRESDDDAPKEWGKAPNGRQSGESFAYGPRSSYFADKEEEEGMIPPE